MSINRLFSKNFPSKLKSGAGFTIVEVLIYLGLFTIIMTGLIAAAYAIFESSGRTQTKTMLQEEGNFLLAKINWALTGATTVTSITAPPSLTITRASSPTLAVFDLNGNNLQITRNGGSGVILNNSNVQITNLNFVHTGSGSNPESVQTSFTLSANLPSGAPYTQDFQTTKYLRK